MKIRNLSFPSVDRDLWMGSQIWYLVNSAIFKVEAASGFGVQQFWPGGQIWNYKSRNGSVQGDTKLAHLIKIRVWSMKKILWVSHTSATVYTLNNSVKYIQSDFKTLD